MRIANIPLVERYYYAIGISIRLCFILH